MNNKDASSQSAAKRQIGIRIPQELDRRLEEVASKIGISKPAFILSVLYRELEHNTSQEIKEHDR